GVSRAFKNGFVGTRLDPFRRHDRWLGTLSCTPQGGVRDGAASNLPVSYCRRGGESGGGGGGQRSQGPGSPTTQTAQRAPEHASSQAGGPHQKAPCRARCRVVHPSVSVCPTAPEQNRTQDRVARQPGIAPVTRVTGSHGPGVCLVRSALSDPDGPRQIGQVAASRPAVHSPW